MQSLLERDGSEQFSKDASPTIDGHQPVDILATFWRYKWAVLLPALLCAGLGYGLFLKTPTTYRSTTRVMVESDRVPVFNSVTGDVIGGGPGIELVESQLFGDHVGRIAFESEAMAGHRIDFENDPARFIRVAKRSLKLAPEIAGYQGEQALVFLMHFENEDRVLCDAAIEAYSGALQLYFNERQKSSRSELLRLITVAIDQLHPKMADLEEKYREFRKTAPLSWDESGDAINPHREQQLYLVQQRRELRAQYRQTETDAATMQAIAKRAVNPLLALSMLQRVVGVEVTMPESSYQMEDVREGDVALAEIELNRNLVPLMIERNKLAAQFGDNHPTVRQLDTELQMMKEELTKLVKEESKRIVELIAERQNSLQPERVKDAKDAINALHDATKTEMTLLEERIAELDDEIQQEKAAAIELAMYEQENAALLREIDRNRQLIDQLEEQMARVSLTEEEGSTRVSELTAPTAAVQVGPDLARSVGIGAFIGLAIGGALALLFEKNAGTFRDSGEISDYLGVPVLTQVPSFRAKAARVKRGEPKKFPDVDPRIAVAHQPSSVASESIRALRTSVFFELSGPNGAIVQVTSPLPGDGKSTIAGNLACAMAQSGKRVLMVDCDLRRPQLTKDFSMSSKRGLTDVLNGGCDVEEGIHETSVANLSVMPSGPIPTNPAEALSMTEMPEMLERLRSEYDFVVVDSPPLLVVTDPSIMASMADGVVMALRRAT